METPIKEISYEPRYCAFVDFLGFSDAVLKGSLTPAEIVAAMKKAAAVTNGSEDLLTATQFSDSLVLSSPANEDWSFLNLTLSLFYLNIELIQHGVLLRGGLSKGNLYHKDGLVFGPAFMRAYHLEQAASTPRIIIDDGISEKSIWPESMLDSEIRKYVRKSLPKDTDGWRYIDYLSPENSGEFDAGAEGLEHHYNTVSNLINIHKNSESPSIRTKYGWLETKLSNALKDK